jgi:hypothetical protein
VRAPGVRSLWGPQAFESLVDWYALVWDKRRVAALKRPVLAVGAGDFPLSVRANPSSLKPICDRRKASNGEGAG